MCPQIYKHPKYGIQKQGRRTIANTNISSAANKYRIWRCNMIMYSVC